MGLGCIMNSSNTVLPEASRYKLQFPLDFYFVIATKNGSAKGTHIVSSTLDYLMERSKVVEAVVN